MEKAGGFRAAASASDVCRSSSGASLIGTGLGFNQEQMTYLISIDIFMCGLATLLQLTVNRFFGIGLPVVLGCAIQAVAPLILIGTNEGVGAIYGSIIASGIFVVLVSGVFSKIKNYSLL